MGNSRSAAISQFYSLHPLYANRGIASPPITKGAPPSGSSFCISKYQTNSEIAYTAPSPAIARTEVRVDQESRVSFNERPKYSLIIQKPASLTWSQKTDPAPTARTIRAAIAELEPNWCAIGATRPAAVIAATVDDPSDTRRIAVISHAARIGEILVCAKRVEIYFEMPPSTRTCLKAPPPPSR